MLDPLEQATFAAGAFPGLEDIPPNGVEDIVDGFLRDDGAIERRGGSVYKSGTATPAAIDLLWDGYLIPGQRTVFGLSSLLSLYVLGTDDSSVVGVGTVTDAGITRPTSVRGILFMAGRTAKNISIYGGSRRAALYNTGTVTTTAGSRTVTGAGTSWLANVDPGMVLSVDPLTSNQAVVESVDSNTQITLRDPWAFATGAGLGYVLSAVRVHAKAADYVPHDAIGAIYDRLVMGSKNRVRFTAAGNPFSIDATDYHDLPQGVQILGLEPAGEVLLAFTTGGVFAISGMAYDLTDDFGNPQQQAHPVSEAVLWSEAGLSRQGTAVIAPCTHDIVVLAASGETRAIGGGIRALYRSYVESGYTAGYAAIHRGHYILPILNGSTWVDTLVCRLDTGAWTRWAGHGGSAVHFAVRTPTATTAPKLLGAKGTRVIDMTGAFIPSSAVKSDADGTAHQLKVTSRSFMLSEVQQHTLRAGTLRYELDDAAADNPTFAAEWSRGRPGSAFTALPGSAGEGEGTYTWWLAKKAQQTRMRFTSNGAAARAIVRAIEVKVRADGRA